MFLVRSAEQIFCPICGSGNFKIIGTRKRTLINSAGDLIILVIRRLRCLDCKKIHHELPDIVVPYKRHASESIETAINGDKKLSAAADESTINRWRNWFTERAGYLLGCLTSIAARYGTRFVAIPSQCPESALQGILSYTGDAPGWLARTVRSIANANLWAHTRFAFCP